MIGWLNEPFAVVYGGPRLPQYSPTEMAQWAKPRTFFDPMLKKAYPIDVEGAKPPC